MFGSFQQSDLPSPLIAAKEEVCSKPDVTEPENLSQMMGQLNSMEHFHLEEQNSPIFQSFHDGSTFLDVKQEVVEEPFAPVKEEFDWMDLPSPQFTEHLNTEDENSEPVQITEADGLEEHDVYYMKTKYPFFDVILTKTHTSPHYQLCVPAKIARELPRATVPVLVRCEHKNWNLSYIGNVIAPRFGSSKWGSFVVGNDLKIGDACVFELVECCSTRITFKITILRGDFPPELAAFGSSRQGDFPPELAALGSSRGTIQDPIELD